MAVFAGGICRYMRASSDNLFPELSPGRLLRLDGGHRRRSAAPPEGNPLREIPKHDDVADALHPAVGDAHRSAPFHKERIRLADEDSVHGAVVDVHDQVVHIAQEHGVVRVYLEPDNFG